MIDPQTLSRREIREIFRRNRGAAYRLAVDIGRSRVTVGLVLRGKATSEYILGAARQRAYEILAAEQSVKGAA